MSLEGDTVTVISILGNDYSIKAPAGKQQALSESVRLLKERLAESKAGSPALIGDRLLVLTALKLCAEQAEQEQRHRQDVQRLEEQVSQRIAGIASLIPR
ncbi:Cell division protein ZapA, inhibits GTPase activity of FtsZ [Pseudomonas guineae]|uniref:Cell division protein ZapA, inhibits GTPase activity of FtsZ n=1 Tax=Pseudomonas guineae TaxID=425504 RepID=A0A1I3J270_9PSED|nr:cell division protein ZapA [Pseudomonas guineae]SFI54185.1 Cell division protein ZapA, inhibits GTPase activity of FtsZ [Pseudomonas guineae]|tara:strand:- start:170 stop:469 length:300 start_codon:yes stop_codon:yes gene_type:complete